MMALVRLLALGVRNLRRNRGRSAITSASLLVGVAMMIFGQGLLNGVQRGVVEDAVLSKIGAIQIYRAGYLEAEQDLLSFDLPDDPALIARLRSVPGVRAVSRRLAFDGMLSNGSISALFVATAIDPRSEYDVCPRRRGQVAAGSTPLSLGDANGALLGQVLADGLGSKKGATLYASATTKNGAPNAIDITVHGHLSDGNGVFENKAGAVLPLALAQDLLRMPGRVTEYALDVDDLERVDDVAAALRTSLGDGYQIKTWRDRPQIRNFVQTMGVIMGFVAFLLSILVISVIVNTMLMSIYERVGEIGTMLALGVRRWQVLMLFLIESAALGLLGALCGALLGLVLLRLTQGGIAMPATALSGTLRIVPFISGTYVIGSIVTATVGAIAAALYPAWTAARMKPVDALRG